MSRGLVGGCAPNLTMSSGSCDKRLWTIALSSPHSSHTYTSKAPKQIINRYCRTNNKTDWYTVKKKKGKKENTLPHPTPTLNNVFCLDFRLVSSRILASVILADRLYLLNSEEFSFLIYSSFVI
jgi:hypothetical protein